MHFWITEEDYRLLIEAARRQERSVGSLLRKLVREHRTDPAATNHASSLRGAGPIVNGGSVKTLGGSVNQN